MLRVLLTRPAISPGAMKVVDAVYQAFLDAGVPPAEIPRLERLFSTFAIGHLLSEVSGRFGDGTLEPRARRAQVPAEELPGHNALADRLDEPVDWAEEFRADLRDLCDLAAALAQRRLAGGTG